MTDLPDAADQSRQSCESERRVDVTVAAAKARLRANLLARRRALDPTVRDAADAAIRSALVTHVSRVRPTTIAAYVPRDGEPGGVLLPEVLAGCLPAGGRLLLPVLLPDLDLDWAQYRDAQPRDAGRGGDLVPGPHGLREPDGRRLGVDAVMEADLIVTPAVAVDRRGTRLGRGGGSYDRALARRPARLGPAPVIALLYDDELVDVLPAAPHDRPVGAVVTPSGFVDLSSRGWTEDGPITHY